MSRSERETGGMLALTGTKVQNPALVEMGEVRGIALGPELKKGQRGAIIADDFGLSGNDESVVVKVLNPNVDTYRMALLFNEVLDLPAFGGFAACAPGDPFGLENMGHVRRSEYLMNGVVRFPEVQAVPILTYEGLNSREPGAWTIWHEPEYDPIPAVFSDPNLAAKLALQDCLLIPGREVPFQDIVEFRERNRKQLLNLREHLERLAIQVASTGPDPALLRLETEALDRAIGEYTEEARKPNWKKAIGNLEITINWTDIAKAAMVPAATVAPFSLTAGGIAALVGGLSSCLSIETFRGLKGAPPGSPYEYVVSIRRELG